MVARAAAARTQPARPPLRQSQARALLAANDPRPGEMRITLTHDVPGYGKKGDVVTMTMSPSDVTGQSLILESMIVGFKQEGFRADDVCPEFLVDLDTGKYQIYGTNNVFKLVNVISSIQADIPEVDVDRTLADYRVQERALGGFVPAVTQWNADNSPGSIDPKANITKRISAALLLDREVRVWTMLTTSGSWNANNRATIAGGSEWNDPTSDAMQDVFDRLNASAQQVTGIWFNPLVAQAFLRNTSVKDYVKFARGDAPPTPRDILEAQATKQSLDFTIPGLPPFHIVGGKVLNESTGNLDFILNDTAVFTSNPPGAGTTGDDIMTCKTFRRRGPNGVGYTVREFPIERRGLHGGTFLATGAAEQVAMISSVVGGAIFDTLQ